MHLPRSEFVFDPELTLTQLSRATSGCSLLLVRPIDACRAQQATCTLVMEAAVKLGLATQWRGQIFAGGGYPVNNGCLQALCVVGSRGIGPLLDLGADAPLSEPRVHKFTT